MSGDPLRYVGGEAIAGGKSPPGAGEHGTGQLSVVDEKTDDGRYCRNI